MLKDNLLATAKKLIDTYGNDCVLYKEVITAKVYNPATDTYTGVDASITLNKKCTYRQQSYNELQETNSNIVSKVATLYHSTDINGLDTSWKLDGLSIVKVDKTQVQNGYVVYKVYVGI